MCGWGDRRKGVIGKLGFFYAQFFCKHEAALK